MSPSSEAVDVKQLHEIREAEIEEVRKRRQQVDPPLPDGEDDVRTSLTGLALSGGGIRSASFNLGLLQAFLRYGLLRHIDYLSTVSGGSYIGSYLSSLLAGSGEPLGPNNRRLNEELRPEHNGKQPERVRRFIRHGQYLDHPLRFVNGYLIGLVLNNLALFSGVVFVCVLLAWLWRWLDTYPIAEWLYAKTAGWGWFRVREINRPFLPATLLLLLWLSGWVVAYLFYLLGWQPKVRGRPTRYLLLGACLCLVVGVAVWLATPNITTSSPTEGARGNQSVIDLTVSKTQQVISSSLLGLILAALVPFLRPKELLQSGLQPTKWYHPWIFRVAGTSLLVGVPSLIIYFFARHDFSDQATQLRTGLSDTDIHFLRFSAFWDKVAREGGEKGEKENRAKRKVPSRIERGKSLGDLIWSKLPCNVCALVMDDVLLKRLEEVPVPLDEGLIRDKKTILDGLNQVIALEDFYHSTQEFKDNTWLERQVQKHNEKDRIELLLDRAMHYRLVGNEVAELNRLLLEVCYPEDIWPRSVIRRHTFVAEGETAKSTLGKWVASTAELIGFKPEHVRLIEWDQRYRLGWLFGSLCVFLLCGITINLNDTSLLGYYRNRLARAFLARKPQTDAEKGGDPRHLHLSELNTTDKGGPYHLISAAWNRLPRLWELLLGKRRPPAGSTKGFIFSRLYCGSPEPVSYCPTDKYVGNRLELAYAMAVSGAAFSPVQVDNPFVVLLMTVLNLRLGQWLPSPVRPSARSRPTVFALLLDAIRRPEVRRYCLLSDGGHYENLGLQPLLQRDCRLIIVSDAGCDPDYAFADFLRVYRRARADLGIRLCRVDEGGDHAIPLDLLRPAGTSRKHPAPQPSTTDEGQTLSDSETGPDPTAELPGCEARLSPRHFLIAGIDYPDGSRGHLVYLKPTLTGDEENDLSGYCRTHKDFPHDPTANQLYDEDQFESYRQLGYHIGEKLCQELVGDRTDTSLWNRDFDEGLQEVFERWLERWQAEQAPQVAPAHALAENAMRVQFLSTGGPSKGSLDRFPAPWPAMHDSFLEVVNRRVGDAVYV
jgi:hypothetical protein